MASAPDLDDVAVSFHNVGYTFDISNRPQHLKIGFRSKTSRKPHDADSSSELMATAAELAVAQALLQGLWVGMYLRSYQRTGKIAKGKTPGIFNALVIPQDTALRVVVECDKEQCNHYALANPDISGLCEGLKVVAANVYYFAEYRNDTLTAVGDRKRKWPAIIWPLAGVQEKLSRPQQAAETGEEVESSGMDYTSSSVQTESRSDAEVSSASGILQ